MGKFRHLFKPKFMEEQIDEIIYYTEQRNEKLRGNGKISLSLSTYLTTIPPPIPNIPPKKCLREKNLPLFWGFTILVTISRKEI